MYKNRGPECDVENGVTREVERSLFGAWGLWAGRAAEIDE